MASILILFAHPLFEKSRVHSRLIAEASKVKGVTINDLYQLYPDFDIDIEREKELLLSHDIIIWQHPFYWYSAPALLKQWQDLVLEHGWAYGKEGRALEGKKFFNVFTSGGGMEAYQHGGFNKFPIQDFLKPFQRTAELCRTHYYSPFWIPGTHKMTNEQVESFALQYRTLLNALTNDQFSHQIIAEQDLMNNLLSTISSTS